MKGTRWHRPQAGVRRCTRHRGRNRLVEAEIRRKLSGYERTENFASPGGAVRSKPNVYEAPARLRLNEWALAGGWTMRGDAAVLNSSNGRIAYRFHARDVHLVIGPSTKGAPVQFRLLIDGRPRGDAHGLDVNAEGYGTVTEQRLYQLVRQPGNVSDRQVEMEFLGSGVEAFAFTFR
jgi:hypothetical protein